MNIKQISYKTNIRKFSRNFCIIFKKFLQSFKNFSGFLAKYKHVRVIFNNIFQKCFKILKIVETFDIDLSKVKYTFRNY